jgi:hypothetical protein
MKTAPRWRDGDTIVQFKRFILKHGGFPEPPICKSEWLNLAGPQNESS